MDGLTFKGNNMYESVQIEMNHGIAKVLLNRPNFFNALDREMVQSLAEMLTRLSCDPLVFGIVITGEGNAFCAGGDLKWLTTQGKSQGEAFYSLAALFHQAVLEIRRMPKPVVAAINGPAVGGGFSMALSCDFRVMEKSAILKQAYTTNGLSIDGGGTFTLPRLVGYAKAMEIIAFDRPISADQALAWGLITNVVEDGQSIERSFMLVKEIRKVPLSSFAASKRLITDSFNTTFETQLEKERVFLSQCADHPNGREGMAAFIEKRKPNYS